MVFTDYYITETVTEYQEIENKETVPNISQPSAPKVTIQLSDLFNTITAVQSMKLFKCEYCLKLYKNEHNLNVHREICRK